jgi:opacity protein-like surface antigen
MKNTIVAFVLAASTVAANATDISSIPSRFSPAAPVASVVSPPKFWVGLNGGGSVTNGINVDTPWSVGAVAGYNFLTVGPVVVGAEATYDYVKGGTHEVGGNALVSVSVGRFTPYVLGGVGYRWTDFGNDQIWSVGAGVKYSIARNVEFDARYRRIENWDRTNHDDRVTLGANFKF